MGPMVFRNIVQGISRFVNVPEGNGDAHRIFGELWKLKAPGEGTYVNPEFVAVLASRFLEGVS